ncbi:MAG: GNAT family N-acetyltransferase [Mesorhizobium sp.]|uniref:GNAT family N-acetyltransferase n=1 Tax=Mesorhizobium sp. TaxID=1871066 RepID=UPI000FE594C8|nr:GNAT family N-acetyltransferase [Mesorhizobium sp.]RWL86596.1 MAG: GNAT family N-acetyltransferase [Mesorhizobium sp.]RWL91418.1 MAG: GNAT family N-acetyltransferase [Mesorhizobium sp.]RWM01246.1 MAG: GNAT family N-acetyltransferase [Mesorhizobium sp.]
MNALEIRVLSDDAATVAMLADLLIETVAAGGSVSFMHPLPVEPARDFWRKSLAAAARGERAVLGAWQDGVLAGTVTLLLDFPPNQPHRAEIAKLMTGRDHRGKGIATRLMRAAEEPAVEKGRTLLVLDTASEAGAAGLYERLGFTLTGAIPDFALKPHGGLTGTLIYWKRIGAGARTLS